MGLRYREPAPGGEREGFEFSMFPSYRNQALCVAIP